MDEYFPRGIWPYLTGGLLVGVGVTLIFVFNGVRAGASGVFTAALGYLSKHPYFDRFRGERTWRTLFSVGLLLGAAVFTVSIGERFVTEVAPWRLALGGFLVGVGTRTARGCTSGHGICGLSSMSSASLAHVITFMAVAILTANVVGRML